MKHVLSLCASLTSLLMLDFSAFYIHVTLRFLYAVFEVSVAMRLQVAVFWVVMRCSAVDGLCATKPSCRLGSCH
jgi:hypothetical protein